MYAALGKELPQFGEDGGVAWRLVEKDTAVLCHRQLLLVQSGVHLSRGIPACIVALGQRFEERLHRPALQLRIVGGRLVGVTKPVESPEQNPGLGFGVNVGMAGESILWSRVEPLRGREMMNARFFIGLIRRGPFS